MIKIEYYSFGGRFYCYLNISGDFKKKFLLPDCKNLFLENEFLMIEVKSKKDYFTSANTNSINMLNALSLKNETVLFSDEKLYIEIEFNNVKHKFKAYVPFWGKVMENRCWTGFISKFKP